MWWMLRQRYRAHVLAVLTMASCGGEDREELAGDAACDACSGEPPDAGPFAYDAGALDTITAGPEGGSFGLLGGAVKLLLPAGALEAQTEISVRLKEDDLLPGAVPGASFELLPEGLKFAAPTELTIAYDPAKVPVAIDPRLLRLHQFVDGQPVLVPGSRVDLVASTVSGVLQHLSDYAPAQVTDDDLLADVERMVVAMAKADEAQRSELEAAVRAAISLLAPRIEAACVATDQVATKGKHIKQLARMGALLQLLGFDADAAQLEPLCGDFWNDQITKIVLTPGDQISLYSGQQMTLSATMYGPNQQRLFGELTWASDDSSIATVTPGATSYSAVATGVETGVASILVYSTELGCETGDCPLKNALLVTVKEASAADAGAVATEHDVLVGDAGMEYGQESFAAP